LSNIKLPYQMREAQVMPSARRAIWVCLKKSLKFFYINSLFLQKSANLKLIWGHRAIAPRRVSPFYGR